MASIKYLVDLDLSKNQLLNAVIQNLAVQPGSPVEGQIFWHTVDKQAYVYDSSYATNNGWRVFGTDDQRADEVEFTPASSNTRITSTDVQDALEKVEVYTTELDNNLAIPNDVGGITAGSLVSDYKDKPVSEILDDLLFPTVDASIATNASVSLSDQTTGTVEVGSPITQSFDVTLNRGSVIDGDGSPSATPELVGLMTNILVTNPNGTDTTVITSPNNLTHSLTVSDSHAITLGSNVWSVNVTNAVGSPVYEDNKGGTDVVSSIDVARQVTARAPKSITMEGRHYRYHYLGAANTHPTTSTGIKALAREFTDANNNGSYTLLIPAGSSECVLYIIQGKTLTVKDLNTNSQMADDITPVPLTVKDGSGNLDINYDKYVIYMGLNGFEQNTDFEVTIS